YRTSALFLDRDGPLVEFLSRAGADVHVAPWSRSVRDPIGALRVWRALRTDRCDIVHSHVGGRFMLRLARRASGGRVVLHVHSRVLETPNGFTTATVNGADADAVVAVSEAAAAIVRGAKPTVVYPGLPFATATKNAVRGDSMVIGALGRLE